MQATNPFAIQARLSACTVLRIYSPYTAAWRWIDLFFFYVASQQKART